MKADRCRLWERWRAESEHFQTFTISTDQPNELVTPISQRMPVILPSDAWRRWLGDDAADIEELLAILQQPYPAELMRRTR